MAVVVLRAKCEGGDDPRVGVYGRVRGIERIAQIGCNKESDRPSALVKGWFHARDGERSGLRDAGEGGGGEVGGRDWGAAVVLLLGGVQEEV